MLLGYEMLYTNEFAGRVLPFDEDAARHTAVIAARLRRTGRTISFRDLQIAGICLFRDATLTTRNRRDFADGGVTLCDPWSD